MMTVSQPGTHPIICNLGAISNRSRYGTLSKLVRAAISGRAELSDGFAFSLNGEIIGLPELAEWITFERQCCPFLNFELSLSGADSIWWLTLTGPDGAKALLDREFPA
jgi:hypothetical protein